MTLADKAQDKVARSLNAEGRSLGHVALGAGVAAVLIGVTAALSARRAPAVAPGGEPVRRPMVKAMWPAVFSVTTLAAMRVWNAPNSRARTRALSLWGVLQASNLALTFWRPTGKTEQVLAATATAGLTAAYARAAADVDQKAASVAAPSGFAGLASLAATPSNS